jgi:hypothetical protein
MKPFRLFDELAAFSIPVLLARHRRVLMQLPTAGGKRSSHSKEE